MSVGIVPLLFLISLVVFALYYFVQSKTAVGTAFFAVGGSERAARMFGLKVSSTKFWAFALSGVGSALAGAFYSIELKTSIASIGDPLTLLAIASVVIGGTPLTGGRGSVLRTLLGALLVVIIQNGLNVAAVDPYWQQIVFGAFTILPSTSTLRRVDGTLSSSRHGTVSLRPSPMTVAVMKDLERRGLIYRITSDKAVQETKPGSDAQSHLRLVRESGQHSLLLVSFNKTAIEQLNAPTVRIGFSSGRETKRNMYLVLSASAARNWGRRPPSGPSRRGLHRADGGFQ